MKQPKDKKEIKIFVPVDLHRKIDIYRTVNRDSDRKKSLSDASVELIKKALA